MCAPGSRFTRLLCKMLRKLETANGDLVVELLAEVVVEVRFVSFLSCS
jgi:hypothetical protein